jgi:flagellar hook-length control protein FliK
LPQETATSLEVSGLAAVGGREAASASPVLRPSAEALVRNSAAVAVRETVEAAVEMRESNRHSVDLVLDTPNAEKLRVHLRWQDGVVQAKFVAQSSELQQALAREWEHAAPRLAERTVKFGEPSFDRHDQPGQSGGQGAFSFEQQRQSSRGREQSAEFGDELGFALSSVRGPNRGTAAVRTVSNTSSLPTPKPADTRNLSAWA